ncbi:MAG TPA: ATP synthase subunit I [Candidatus Deferrimicrobiaceae bacterium]
MGSEGRTDGDPGLSIRPVERKILLCAAAVVAGIALSGRFGLLPGAAVGGLIAYGNFVLIRRILEKAFSGGGTVGKGFVVQYLLKFLALAAVVYAVVRSRRFDAGGFLLGLSSLFLGVLLEGIARSFKSRQGGTDRCGK